MAEEPKPPKWQGKATAHLTTTTGDQVWPLLQDFCNFHKIHPTLDTCHHVHGLPGHPGLTRYCSATTTTTVLHPQSNPIPNSDQPPTTLVKWCYETLLSIDNDNRCLKYAIGENNLGFESYVAELRVVDGDGDGDGGGGGGGCRVEWWFWSDPVEGMGFGDLVGYVEVSLKGMVEKLEREVHEAVAN